MDEEDQKQQQGQQGSEQVLSGESGQVDAGGGDAGGSAPAPGGQSSAAPKGTQGSKGWTNLTRYVDANKGADAKMGQALQSNIAGRGQKANEAATGYQNQASAAVNAGTAKDNGLMDRIRNSASSVSKEEYDQAANAGYTGPKAYNDGQLGQGFQNAESQVKQTSDLANSTDTFEGRTKLLDETYKQPSYSSGEKRLDSFLVGGGEQGAAAMKDIQQNYGTGSDFTKGWEGLVNKVQGDIGAANAASAKNAADTKAAAATAQGNVAKSLQANAKAAQNAAQAKNTQQFSSAMGKLNHPDPVVQNQGWRELGIDPNTAHQALKLGISPAQIVQQSQVQDVSAFYQPKDVANYKSLLSMTGGEPAVELDKQLDPWNLGKANTGITAKADELAALEQEIRNNGARNATTLAEAASPAQQAKWASLMQYLSQYGAKDRFEDDI